MNTKETLAYLRKVGTVREVRSQPRYGIFTKRAFGVPMRTLLVLAKQAGKDHALAAGLWKSGWYEARLLAALVDDPRLVTRAQMNTWAGAFDNWAVCDTACFHLFDRTPYAWEMVGRWTASNREFVKRAGSWLISCLAVHDKAAPEAKVRALLPRIKKGARDERIFVQKAVSSALRTIGKSKPSVRAAARATAERLVNAKDAGSIWVGRDALPELRKAKARAPRAAKEGRRASSSG